MPIRKLIENNEKEAYFNEMEGIIWLCGTLIF